MRSTLLAGMVQYFVRRDACNATFYTRTGERAFTLENGRVRVADPANREPSTGETLHVYSDETPDRDKLSRTAKITARLWAAARVDAFPVVLDDVVPVDEMAMLVKDANRRAADALALRAAVRRGAPPGRHQA